MRRIYCLLVMLLTATAWGEPVQFPEDTSEIAFRQALKDMSNDLRLMCVAAHPDDEDGATLAYHRYKHGIKTYALIGTRGEGGQNEIGPELYEDLAVIRTKEMMDAAKIEGAELHFLDMPDFGFSKTIEETFEKWGKEVLLEKMVRKIREIRPHVIITHHGRMKDHGHHQAIGWAVQEAFDKAADKDALTDSGQPWQVQRLYIRDFSGNSETAAVINISEKDELRGKTYAEIAADALRAHKSQGMEFFIQRLLAPDVKGYYDLVKEAEGRGQLTASEQSGLLFKGVSHRITIELSDEDVQDRAKLLEVLKEKFLHLDVGLASGPPDEQFEEMLVAKYVAIATRALAEVSLYVEASDPLAVPGQTVNVRVTHEDRGTIEATEVLHTSLSHGLGPQRIQQAVDAEGGASSLFEYTASIPNLPEARHVFETQPTQSTATVLTTLRNENDILTSFQSPIEIDVAPPVLPEFLEAPYLVRTARLRPVVVKVRLTNYTPGAHAQEVRFVAPEGWGLTLGITNQSRDPFGRTAQDSLPMPPSTLAYEAVFTEEDEEQHIRITLTPPKDVALGSYSITAETAGLDFVPEAKVQVSDVKRSEYNEDPNFWTSGALAIEYPIGLIDSYDTTFRDTLTKMGFEFFSQIEQGAITEDRLKQYRTILVDMRSYLYRPDLKANNAILLEWCKRGGRLIVNYHKTFDWSSDFAPYKLVLSNNRVTIEDAPVKHLVPEHPWFNYPNKITPEDWDGWRQERGLYFAGQWDEAFTPLIETSDPDEIIPPGSCLIADYGEGKYFYTALVWYRQLRELHPGALKLFANMLAL